jgi:hypothetical protein
MTDQLPLPPEPKPKRKPKKALVAAGNRGLVFSDLDSMYRFCVAVANSKEFKDIDTPEQALMRLQAGLELGLSPIWSICNIMVVNGRPSVWGDAMLGLVLRHPECEDVIETIEHEGTEEEAAVCEVHRRGRVPVIRKFSVADVKRAGLDKKYQSVHGSYPQRMRQMRARSWACRDAFADTLRGLAVVEEMRDNGKSIERPKIAQTKELILPDNLPVPVLAEPRTVSKSPSQTNEPSEHGEARESKSMVPDDRVAHDTNALGGSESDSRGGEKPPDESDELPF